MNKNNNQRKKEEKRVKNKNGKKNLTDCYAITFTDR